MVTTLLQPHAAVLGGRLVPGARLLVEDGRIRATATDDFDADRTLPLAGLLLPGAIDLQVNGGAGFEVATTTPRALDAIATQVWRGGATAFLPTLITAPFDALLDRLRAVAAWIDRFELRPDAATPLGIHLEGPFLEAPGAHDPRHLIDPTPDRVDAVLRATGSHLALVTLAPARPGAPAAVARLRQAGVAVSLGHATSPDQLDACVAAGARLATHLFNAMGPLHHRRPGFAAHVLDRPALAASLIPDGFHVHEIVLRNAWRCLGPRRTVLITDAVAAAGMPDGPSTLGGQPVELRDGTVRDGEGRLAGAALTMSEAARRWRAMVPDAADADLAAVLSTNAAALLGDDARGELAPGRLAELGLWDGQKLTALRA